MKNLLVKGVLLVTASAGLAACGPVVPANPTWEHDIRPLMVARCIRCHDETPHVDPLSKRVPIGNFNYLTLTDPLQVQLGLLRTYGPGLLRGPVAPFPQRMPPPPAEALEDWQIEMLDTWAKNPPR